MTEPMLTFFNWFTKITGYPFFLIAFKTKVFYQNRKVQGRRIRGKALVVTNHRAIYDFAVWMFVFFTRTLRCIVAEVTYDLNPVLHALLKMWGAIRVDRHDNDFEFMWKSIDILKKGGVVEIFPESRIPEKDEPTPLEFKPSYVYIALRSDAPIIPVFTDGCYFSKKRSHVMIGTPIYASELYDESLGERENIEAINSFVRSRIIELGEELEKRKKGR